MEEINLYEMLTEFSIVRWVVVVLDVMVGLFLLKNGTNVLCLKHFLIRNVDNAPSFSKGVFSVKKELVENIGPGINSSPSGNYSHQQSYHQISLEGRQIARLSGGSA